MSHLFAHTAPVVRLRTLGRVEAVGVDGGVREELSRQSKLIALLAYIAVEARSRTVSIEMVCEVFWPAAELTRARRALNQLLHTGRSLGIDAVERVGSGQLALRPGVLTCDAAELLDGSVDGEWVLQNYAGELLPGFRLSGGDALDDWLDRTRTRLRVRAVERLVADGSAAEPERALALVRRALELDPYCENAATISVEALGTARGRADAWRFFEEFRSRVRDELDLDAPPALVRCVMRVCSSDTNSHMSNSDTTRQPVTLGRATATAGPPPVDIPAERGVVPRRARANLIVRTGVVIAVLLVMTAAVKRWILPERAAAGEAGEIAAHLMIESSADDPMWRSIVAPELAKQFADRGMRIAQDEGDTDPWRLAPFSLAGEVRTLGDTVIGLVQLHDTRTRRVLGAWRVEAAPNELRERLATVGDSARTMMRRADAGREIRGADRLAEAVAALLAARSRLNAAATAARRSALQVAAIEFRTADSLALSAIVLEPGWAQAHLIRAELLEWRALLHLGSGDTLRARNVILEAVAAATRAVDLGGGTPALERRGGLLYLVWMLAAPAQTDPRMAAVADLERAARTGDASAQTWAVLSALHHAAGRMADADVAARKALAADVFGRHTENILLRLFLAAFDGGRDADGRTWCAELRRRSAGRSHAVQCELATLAWSGPDGNAKLGAVDLSLRDDIPPMAAAMRPRLELVRAAAYASNGDSERAVAIMDSLLVVTRDDSELPYYVAMVHAQPGWLDSARSLLTTYVGSGGPSRRSVLYGRWFQPLHERSGSAADFVLSFD
ncbi:MAG: BTAD domain-containing putative transcriptional regulator [Gemmatimonadota bacterium]